MLGSDYWHVLVGEGECPHLVDQFANFFVAFVVGLHIPARSAIIVMRGAVGFRRQPVERHVASAAFPGLANLAGAEIEQQVRRREPRDRRPLFTTGLEFRVVGEHFDHAGCFRVLGIAGHCDGVTLDGDVRIGLGGIRIAEDAGMGEADVAEIQQVVDHQAVMAFRA